MQDGQPIPLPADTLLALEEAELVELPTPAGEEEQDEPWEEPEPSKWHGQFSTRARAASYSLRGPTVLNAASQTPLPPGCAS